MKINFNKKMGLKIALISMLVLVALILGILFFYLPRYLTKDVIVTPTAKEGEELTIMSTNVRCYAPDDLFKKSLFYRMELIATDVCAVMPDVICFQEMQGLHYNYLEEVMPDYASVMAFRDNSIIREGCSIFYRTDRFEEIESGHFWLSNQQVEQERPMLHVPDVRLDASFHLIEFLGLAAESSHLRPSGDTRFHEVTYHVIINQL